MIKLNKFKHNKICRWTKHGARHLTQEILDGFIYNDTSAVKFYDFWVFYDCKHSILFCHLTIENKQKIGTFILMTDGNILLGDADMYNYIKDYLGGLCISLSGLGGVSTVAVKRN